MKQKELRAYFMQREVEKASEGVQHYIELSEKQVEEHDASDFPTHDGILLIFVQRDDDDPTLSVCLGCCRDEVYTVYEEEDKTLGTKVKRWMNIPWGWYTT